MKYELEKLNEIISVSLWPRNLIKQKNREAILQKCHTEVCTEIARIKNQFTEAIFNCENDNRITCYVQQHQHTITRLTDILFTNQLKDGLDSIFRFPSLQSKRNYYETMHSYVFQLLEFVQIHYNKYFNKSSKIPDHLRVEYINKYKQTTKETRAILLEHGITEELVNFQMHPFEKMVSSKEVSYQFYEYVKTFQIEIDRFIKSEDISANSLCDLLIQVNYNNTDFVKFYINQLKDNSSAIVDTASLAEYYYQQLKDLNQMASKSGLAYDSSLPCIRDQIGTWLAEEIYFIEKKQQLAKLPVDISPTTDNEPKIHTSLSVAHLSLAVKLLIDAKVIKNKNSTELMKLVARNFKTDSREQISEDSLRNKSYSYDERTVDQVKDLVKGLMGVVMRY